MTRPACKLWPLLAQEEEWRLREDPATGESGAEPWAVTEPTPAHQGKSQVELVTLPAQSSSQSEKPLAGDEVNGELSRLKVSEGCCQGILRF